MQAAKRIFLGRTAIGERDYYVRQLRDMKGSIRLQLAPSELWITPASVVPFARTRSIWRPGGNCGLSGPGGEAFAVRAISRFAASYADQTESDHKRLLEAAESGG